MKLISTILSFFLPSFRQKELETSRSSALANYHLIKAMIMKAHFAKQNGLTIQLSTVTLDDIKSFRAPMYRFSFNKDAELRIAWDFDMMTEEIGSGEKFVAGERAESTPGKVLSEVGEAGV